MYLSMMLKRLFAMGFSPAGLAFKTGIPKEMLLRIAENGEVNLAEFGKEIGSEKLSRLSILLGQMMLVHPETDPHYLSDKLRTLQSLFDLSYAAFAEYLGLPEETVRTGIESGDDSCFLAAERKIHWLEGCLKGDPRFLGIMPPFEEKYPRISREKVSAERSNASQTIKI